MLKPLKNTTPTVSITYYDIFIDLNGKGGHPPVYKDDFTIGNDGVPICREGFRMRRDGTETAKGRTKFKCPGISFAGAPPSRAELDIKQAPDHRFYAGDRERF